MPLLSQLVDDHPLLQELFEFCATIIEDLLAALVMASGETQPSYYAADGGAYTPQGLWPVGITTKASAEYLVTVL